MNKEQIIKSTQEQAVASWINYINSIRINYVLKLLQEQKGNLRDASERIMNALNEVNKIIETNRGGAKGIHGFLAEAAENGIANAKRLIIGEKENLKWLNDNGTWDFERDGVSIQMKFSQGKGLFSLDASLSHFNKYRDILPEDYKYSIPKDHYKKVKFLYNLSEKEAYKKLSSSTDPTIGQWRKVHDFFEHGELKFEQFEGCNIKYSDAQKEKIKDTIDSAKKEINEIDREQRDVDYTKGRASLEEMGEVALASAAIEGGTTFVIEIVKKLKSGTSINEFTKEDWNDILKKSGISTAKGGIRGISMYSISNCTTFFIDDSKAVVTTPAAIASALVTASFGVAEQINLYRKGNLDELQLIENSEILCLDCAMSAVASLLGQTLIPIPVLGAIIGNTVGTTMYQIVKDHFADDEVRLFERFLSEQKKLDDKLNTGFGEYINNINSSITIFVDVLSRAFSINAVDSFNGSIELLRRLEIQEGMILKTIDDVNNYFLS